MDGDGIRLVASVCVDTPGPHLDHPFSYAVPAAMAETVRPGVRVRVPFAGRDAAGWVLDVAPAQSAGTGPDDPPQSLRPLRRVVSPLPVLDPGIAVVARAVADHYAGTLADVLRTAVPTRHAATEAAMAAERVVPFEHEHEHGNGNGNGAAGGRAKAGDGGVGEPGSWASMTGGEAFLRRVGSGEAPAAAALLPLVADPWSAFAVLAMRAVAADRTMLLLVPDATDLARAAAAVPAGLRVLTLHHALGPAARWRAFLSVRAGLADVVVGTRAAAFAPVPRLGVVAVWDDGDDAHHEPRAPGWHVRVVARLRARQSGAALVLAGHSRSVPTQWLIRQGTLKALEPPRAVRRLAARVAAPDNDDPVQGGARLPRQAHAVIAASLVRGPVLISVARRGYAPSLACQHCRRPARCRQCRGGSLLLHGALNAPTCGWCGREDPRWACPACGGRQLRAAAVGNRRTAEELGKAFRGTPVLSSDASHRLTDVDATPRLVIATPGAEPAAAGGYAAAVILDGDAALHREGLGAPEEAVRRWLHVVSLVRSVAQDGSVVLVADPAEPAVQAVLAGAPERFADRQCDERAESGLPPAAIAASLVGDAAAVAQAALWLRGDDTLAGALVPGESPWRWDGVDGSRAGSVGGAARMAPGRIEVLGPVIVAAGGDRDSPSTTARLLVLGARAEVVAAVRDVLRRRSARHLSGGLSGRVDPADL